MLAEHKLDPAQVPGTGKGGRITTGDVVDYLEKGGAAAAPAPAPTSPGGFDPGGVPRSGPGGKITRADLQGALGAAALAAKAPASAAPAAGPREERVRMTKLRQTIARRLKEAQNTAAMLTTFNEVDMGAVMALRGQYKEAFEKKHEVRSASIPSSPRPSSRACRKSRRSTPASTATRSSTTSSSTSAWRSRRPTA